MSSCYKAKLSENHYKYSSINMNFIRVVTWLKVAGLWRKGYKDSKYICGLEKFNQDHQGLMSFPSSCSFFFFSFFYFFYFFFYSFFFLFFFKSFGCRTFISDNTPWWIKSFWQLFLWWISSLRSFN